MNGLCEYWTIWLAFIMSGECIIHIGGFKESFLKLIGCLMDLMEWLIIGRVDSGNINKLIDFYIFDFLYDLLYSLIFSLLASLHSFI